MVTGGRQGSNDHRRLRLQDRSHFPGSLPCELAGDHGHQRGLLEVDIVSKVAALRRKIVKALSVESYPDNHGDVEFPVVVLPYGVPATRSAI